MRIGVDVGGTNTDAVLMDGRSILAFHKAPTTSDIAGGIVAAIREVCISATVKPAALKAVMIGTTQFTNAFVEARQLVDVGVVRIGLPAGRAIPPLSDWPDRLRNVLGSHVVQVRGGYHFDGRENAALNEGEVRDAAHAFRASGVRAIAIAGIFSQVNSEQEERAAAILREMLPGSHITLSHRIGRIGMLERENAAIINASLQGLSKTVLGSFARSLEELQIAAPFFISQNDGTLMSADFAAHYPVLTFASGPTNSMRGAAYLSGVRDALVADIGGTTTDVGMLTEGFPRESAVATSVGGVRTNFRMPDVLSIGLGGGSLVQSLGDKVAVGPKSVGYRLPQESLVFGGTTLTATDVAVAGRMARIGDPALVGHLDAHLVNTALDRMHGMLEEAVDRMKVSPQSVPLILVGGGAILISKPVRGTAETIVPPHAGVANAVGAAIAQAGGEVDRVVSYERVGREAAIRQAEAEAISEAVTAGAVRETVRIMDVEEVHLQYVPGGVVRLRVRAVGDLVIERRS